jgi:YD repeat-containing protein
MRNTLIGIISLLAIIFSGNCGWSDDEIVRSDYLNIFPGFTERLSYLNEYSSTYLLGRATLPAGDWHGYTEQTFQDWSRTEFSTNENDNKPGEYTMGNGAIVTLILPVFTGLGAQFQEGKDMEPVDVGFALLPKTSSINVNFNFVIGIGTSPVSCYQKVWNTGSSFELNEPFDGVFDYYDAHGDITSTTAYASAGDEIYFSLVGRTYHESVVPEWPTMQLILERGARTYSHTESYKLPCPSGGCGGPSCGQAGGGFPDNEGIGGCGDMVTGSINPRSAMCLGSDFSDEYEGTRIDFDTRFSASVDSSMMLFRPFQGGVSDPSDKWIMGGMRVLERRSSSSVYHLYEGVQPLATIYVTGATHCWGFPSGATEAIYGATQIFFVDPGGATGEFEKVADEWWVETKRALDDGTTIDFDYTYTYNSSYRLDSISYPDNETTNLVYDATGDLTCITRRNGDSLGFVHAGNFKTATFVKSGTTVPTSSIGWSHNTSNMQIDSVFEFVGAGLTTSVTRAHYTYSDGLVESVTSNGIEITFDPMSSEDVGSYRIASSTDGTNTYMTNECIVEYVDMATKTIYYKTYAGDYNDAVINSSTLYYNEHGLLKEATSHHGGVTQYHYQYDEDSSYPMSQWGNVLSVTDEFGRWIDNVYSATDANGAIEANYLLTTYNYDSADELVTCSSYVYDATGNLLKSGSWDVDDGNWLTYTENTYVWNATDENYDLLSTSDGEGRTSYYVYDATGRIIQTGTGSATTTYEYDSNGHSSKSTFPTSIEIEYGYYDSGSIASVTNASGTTRYEYSNDNEGDQLVALYDALDQKTGYEYDDQGRLQATNIYAGTSSYALHASSAYSYDYFGRIGTTTDFNGSSKNFEYDILGRMVRKTYGNSIDPPWINYNYDTQGYLTSIESDCGIGCQDTINYSYNTEGRLQYRTGVNYGSIGYVYDDAGRPKTHIWPISKGSETSVARTTSLTYTYDNASRIAAIYPDGKPQALAYYTYNDAGQTETIDLENGTSVEMTYDSTYGRLTLLTNYESDGSTAMTSFAYAYNLDGYVTSVARENGDVISYAYDGVGRLTDEWVKDTTGSTVYRNEFEYDAVGNRTEWIQTDNIAGCTTFKYTYNTLNQLTDRTWTGQNEEYTYDLNGNLTQKVEKVSGTTDEVWEYTWDHEDRLVKVVQKNAQGETQKTVEYAYCVSCGGSLTHKIVKDDTGTITKWIAFESEGSAQLRTDEKWDSNGNNIIEATDEWRTHRITYNAMLGAQKEMICSYINNSTDTAISSSMVYFHYDGFGYTTALSNNNGLLINNQLLGIDSAYQIIGPMDLTNRRASYYDKDSELYNINGKWSDLSALSIRESSSDKSTHVNVQELMGICERECAAAGNMASSVLGNGLLGGYGDSCGGLADSQCKCMSECIEKFKSSQNRSIREAYDRAKTKCKVAVVFHRSYTHLNYPTYSFPTTHPDYAEPSVVFEVVHYQCQWSCNPDNWWPGQGTTARCPSWPGIWWVPETPHTPTCTYTDQDDPTGPGIPTGPVVNWPIKVKHEDQL